MDAAATAAPVPPRPCYVGSATSTPRSTDPWDLTDDNQHHQPTPPSPLSSPKSSSSLSGSTARLRLMCSYGGRIVPRPTDKALRYLGGETRIVAVDRAAPLSDLRLRLSRILHLPNPNPNGFSIKYQLPSEDLDSLISLATDEDLDNLIEEYDRINSSTIKSTVRIRLFIFPEQSSSNSNSNSNSGLPAVGSLLADSSKADAWFVDALNGALPRKHSVDSNSASSLLLGLEDETAQPPPEKGSAAAEAAAARQQDVQSVPDSPMMLETAYSSFGSSSSAFSLSNLPPIRVRPAASSGGIEEQFAQMSVGGTAAAAGVGQKTPTVCSLEEHTENSEKFFSSDEKSDHGSGDGTDKRTTHHPHHLPVIDTVNTRQVGVHGSNPSGYTLPLMNAEQLQFHQFAQHQQQQFVHGTPQYVHHQQSTNYYQMPPYAIQQQQQQQQQQHQSYAYDQQMPMYLVPVQQPPPPPMPYNLAPQISSSITEDRKPMAPPSGQGSSFAAPTPAPAPTSIVHGQHYMGVNYHHPHLMHQNYAYGYGPPTSSQGYYMTSAALPPQYQTVNGEVSAQSQHAELKQATRES